MSKGEVFKSLHDAMRVLAQRNEEEAGGRSYGALADAFDRNRDAKRGWEWEVLKAHLPVREGRKLEPGEARVLDIGCGTGASTRGLKLDGFEHVIGAEPDTRMLERARGKGDEIEYVEAFASKLPFPDSSFDAITIHWAFDNFGNDPASITEIKRVLKPDGVLVIVTGTIEGFAKEGREVIGKYASSPPPVSPIAAPDGESSAGLLREKYGFTNVETFVKEDRIPYTADKAFHSFDASIVRNRVPQEKVAEMEAELRAYCEAEAEKDRATGGEGILYRPRKTIVDIARR